LPASCRYTRCWKDPLAVDSLKDKLKFCNIKRDKRVSPRNT